MTPPNQTMCFSSSPSSALSTTAANRRAERWRKRSPRTRAATTPAPRGQKRRRARTTVWATSISPRASIILPPPKSPSDARPQSTGTHAHAHAHPAHTPQQKNPRGRERRGRDLFVARAPGAMSQEGAPPWWDDGLSDLIQRRAPMPSTFFFERERGARERGGGVKSRFGQQRSPLALSLAGVARPPTSLDESAVLRCPALSPLIHTRARARAPPLSASLSREGERLLRRAAKRGRRGVGARTAAAPRARAPHFSPLLPTTPQTPSKQNKTKNKKQKTPSAGRPPTSGTSASPRPPPTRRGACRRRAGTPTSLRSRSRWRWSRKSRCCTTDSRPTWSR